MGDIEKYKSLLKLLTEDIANVKNIKNPLNKRKRKNGLRQEETDFIEYSVIEKVLFRDKKNDRVIPIDNLTLNDFNLDLNTNIENVEIHYGPNSDELTRSHHATALTIGNAIYFRNNAYKPETEEGRKTLAHELTHIHQGKEDILEGQRPVSELENEAKNAEKIAEYNPDRYREITFKGKKYKVTEKQYKQIMKDIKDKVEEAIANNIMNLNEEEYLKFIIAYKNMQENGEFIWQQ